MLRLASDFTQSGNSGRLAYRASLPMRGAQALRRWCARTVSVRDLTCPSRSGESPEPKVRDTHQSSRRADALQPGGLLWPSARARQASHTCDLAWPTRLATARGVRTLTTGRPSRSGWSYASGSGMVSRMVGSKNRELSSVGFPTTITSISGVGSPGRKNSV